MERLNREVRRRANVVELVFAQQHNQWQVSRGC
ncbi:MAG: hypothetical protein ACUVS3_11665 [Thermodesulfobacteriota bacterium]